MRIIFTRIGCTLLTCDMYMSDLRHIHDLVLSSLKMEGIRLLYLPTPPQPTLPQLCLRNAYKGYRFEKHRNSSRDT
jgi:hypothetical protein